MSSILSAGVESHAHRLAKDLMVKWLRGAAAEVGLDGNANFCGIGWRVNRRRPHWGVWFEYPFCIPCSTVWDERSDRWKCRPPTYSELLVIDIAPKVIVDIAVQHKGRIAWAIEIVHKHAVGNEKSEFLRLWTDLTLIEIPAYWVLGQVGVPTEIPREFFLSW